MNTRNLADEYNPLLHPEEHTQTALRWSYVWLAIQPWIEADLVHFRPNTRNIDADLMFKASRMTLDRYARHPELAEAARALAEDKTSIA